MNSTALCLVGEYSDCVPGITLQFTGFDRAHPRNFQKIADQLKDCNIWTNNPLIVDCFPAEKVLVCQGGLSKVLAQHSLYRQWKDEMTAGELWSMFGEDWVVD